MPDYNPQDFSPSYGGKIDSNGNIKNIADAITGTGADTKVKVDIGDSLSQVIFIQGTPVTTWTIDHNTGRFPQVTTVDGDGVQIVGQIAWPNNNQVVITFSLPTAGKAFLT